MQNEILTRDEVADYLRVTRGWLDHLAVRGDGPRFYRAGRAIRYKRSDVLNWLETQNYSPPAKAA